MTGTGSKLIARRRVFRRDAWRLLLHGVPHEPSGHVPRGRGGPLFRGCQLRGAWRLHDDAWPHARDVPPLLCDVRLLCLPSFVLLPRNRFDRPLKSVSGNLSEYARARFRFGEGLLNFPTISEKQVFRN